MVNWATGDEMFGIARPEAVVTLSTGLSVKVVGMSVGEKDEYENETVQVTAGSHEVTIKHGRALLLIRTVRDQHGRPLWAKADFGKILELPAMVVEPLYNKARELSGMPVGEIEDLVGNSEATDASGSDTDSPDISDGPSKK